MGAIGRFAKLATLNPLPSTAYLVAWSRGGKVVDVGVYSEPTPTPHAPLNSPDRETSQVLATVERATYAEASRVLLLRASRTMANGFPHFQAQLRELQSRVA